MQVCFEWAVCVFVVSTLQAVCVFCIFVVCTAQVVRIYRCCGGGSIREDRHRRH